jgi:RNA polymerase sigma factor (sigma-70 family)
VDDDNTVDPPDDDLHGYEYTPVGQFCREHYRRLVRTTMYAGATKEEAMEAVSGALEDLVRAWDRVDFPLTWSSRAALNHFRREKNKVHRLRRRLLENGAGTPDGADDPQLTLWEDQQWVIQMLDSLPPKQREVMALVIANFEPAEIARLLGRTPGAVRQSLLEARRRLKPAIAQERASEQQPGSSAKERVG